MASLVIPPTSERSLPAGNLMAADNQPRSMLLLQIAAGDAHFSWKSGETTTGISLAVGVPLAITGIEAASADIYIYSTAGTTVSYVSFPPR